jgi:hypothetical protein
MRTEADIDQPHTRVDLHVKYVIGRNKLHSPSILHILVCRDLNNLLKQVLGVGTELGDSGGGDARLGAARARLYPG